MLPNDADWEDDGFFEPNFVDGDDTYDDSVPNNFSTTNDDDSDIENEPPLLEELEINFDNIWKKTKYVIWPFRSWDSLDVDVLKDGDVTGPLVFLAGFGACLLLMGRAYFGALYQFFIGFGIVLNTLFNLMTQNTAGIEMVRTFSILGYSILPVVCLSCLGVFFSLQNLLGTIACCACVVWSSWIAVSFIVAVADMKDQWKLVMYPLMLFYTVFAIISVF